MSEQSAHTLTEPPPKSLRCMEIWGGNQAFDNAISVSGMDAWLYSRPYRDADSGGDIYYVSTCGHGRIARFAVADVAGHGAHVGRLGARLRMLMRKHINTLDQARFVRMLNEEFLRFDAGGKFATALLTSYYAPTDDLVVCNAGHPPPLWYRADTDTWQLLTQSSPQTVNKVFNLPLGIIEPTPYFQFAVKLARNDVILIHTDSLTEATNKQGRQLTSEGLLNLARKLDPTEPQRIKDAVLAAVRAYQGHDDFTDDVTLLVLHHNAADPPRMSVTDYATVMGKALRLIKV